MANLTLDHVKTIAQSILASATRYKPNLSVTDPDDPRYVVGADKVAKMQGDVTKMKMRLTTLERYEDETNNLASNAENTANSAQIDADNAKSLANAALNMSNSAKTTAENAKTTAENAKTTAENAKDDWLEFRPSAMGYIRNKPFGDKISQSISLHPSSIYFNYDSTNCIYEKKNNADNATMYNNSTEYTMRHVFVKTISKGGCVLSERTVESKKYSNSYYSIWGNAAYLDGDSIYGEFVEEDNGEPVCIIQQSPLSVGFVSSAGKIFTKDVEDVESIELIVTQTVDCIEDKYIPGSIARSPLVVNFTIGEPIENGVSFTCDMTFAQIRSAFVSGKDVIGKLEYNNAFYSFHVPKFSNRSDEDVLFLCENFSNEEKFILMVSRISHKSSEPNVLNAFEFESSPIAFFAE